MVDRIYTTVTFSFLSLPMNIDFTLEYVIRIYFWLSVIFFLYPKNRKSPCRPRCTDLINAI